MQMILANRRRQTNTISALYINITFLRFTDNESSYISISFEGNTVAYFPDGTM